MTEYNEKIWREIYNKKEGIALCMSPQWLLNGCPICGHKKWSVTGDCYAYCKKCSIGIPTDFPFTSRNTVSDFPFEQEIITEDDLTDMFGEGGKEEIKDYYKIQCTP